ncbi:esterase-like activity of phytase family protein [Thiolinea disciformis]|uniref:esterase-like activity of phytase family protein n=1 Tax=Thiolinea disciformis TaxID=125614 RepID=UPI00037798C3|nr:esterase-like activity of phytase family protein [Thiolinea disciformis]
MIIKINKRSGVRAALLALLLSACSAPSLKAEDSAYQLTILDQITLARDTLNQQVITELSDLAWDADEQVLYAISDKGILFHFKLSIKNNNLNVKPIAAFPLVDGKAKPLKPRDAEGLTVLNDQNGRKGDSQLVVAMEGIPRLVRTDTKARQIGEDPLNPLLKNRKLYRSGNDMLESVIFHPRLGLLTAPEMSLKTQAETMHTIYSPTRTWSFPAYPSAKSSITALEVLPDQSLLVLERAWAGFPNPFVISLRRVDILNCKPKTPCAVQNLAVFSGLLSIDNFEGLTHIKDNLYLMVSDDNQSDLLSTKLTLFKID